MLPYAMGQWLHSYEHGFIKRGLLGTILRPVFQWKNSEELSVVLQTIGFTILLATVVTFLWAARTLLRAAQERGELLPAGVATAVMAVSPAVVMGGHFAGYFEQFVIPASAVALFLGLTGRWFLAGLVCALSVFVHELAVLVGAPMVCFAALASPLPGGESRGRTWRARRLLAVGGPVVAASAVIHVFGEGGPEALSALRDDLRATKLFTEGVVGATTYHLEVNALRDVTRTPELGWSRITQPTMLRTVVPSLAVLLLVGSLALARRRRPWLIPLLWLCSLSPLVMHWVAWDTGRISGFTAVNAYFGVFVAICASGAPSVPKLRPTVGAAATAIGIGAVAWTVATPVWSIGAPVPTGPFAVRAAPAPPDDYRCARPLFPNSTFEAGSFDNWTRTGTAFDRAPLGMNPEAYSEWPGKEGTFWVASNHHRLEKRVVKVADTYVGELTSTEFDLDGDSLNFLVAGGKDAENVYVALNVDGVEVARAAGLNWVHMRTIAWDVAQYRGRTAQIVIADAAKGGWGHIMADGFCYR